MGPKGTPGGQPTDSSSHAASRDSNWTCGRSFRQSACHPRRPSHRRPNHPAREGKYIADHIPGAKYVELPGRNEYHFVEPMARVLSGDRRVPHRPAG